MNTYYHEVDALAFQYQIASISEEMNFRVSELIEASRAELLTFYEAIRAQSPAECMEKGIVPYRFSSLLALLQTFRDALRGALGKDFDFSPLDDDVPHASLFRQLRNALVHDGYQPIALWVEGRYYLPANFTRQDHRGKPVNVNAPEHDVETLALEYSEAYCTRLASLLDALSADKKLRGPQRSYEWFRAAWSHPVLAKFKSIEMPSRAEWPVHPESAPAPLDLAEIRLRDISRLCAARLEELRALPDVPFP
ncbi:hypothetical protein MNU23_28655 [Pseudomonas aeruginosa]|uniref:hypothetical protein n=1 Tax=Pseudomonas aeruginosa TaxID=287 RepID=UPI0021A8523F|nr:hypothetical protein [Pseudomonas aeruginosa]MCT2415653.1 hypothetical protein [Pseudomonas aeruginosa]HCF2593181.1 hypothetical protein [Pseudomonas aeruginosa]